MVERDNVGNIGNIGVSISYLESSHARNKKLAEHGSEYRKKASKLEALILKRPWYVKFILEPIIKLFNIRKYYRLTPVITTDDFEVSETLNMPIMLTQNETLNLLKKNDINRYNFIKTMVSSGVFYEIETLAISKHKVRVVYTIPKVKVIEAIPYFKGSSTKDIMMLVEKYYREAEARRE